MCQGSVCLLYRPLRTLFSGDHVAGSGGGEEGLFTLFKQYCLYQGTPTFFSYPSLPLCVCVFVCVWVGGWLLFLGRHSLQGCVALRLKTRQALFSGDHLAFSDKENGLTMFTFVNWFSGMPNNHSFQGRGYFDFLNAEVYLFVERGRPTAYSGMA